MYRQIQDFLTDLAAEAESTLKVFRAIPERAAGQAIVPGGRTLSRLVWHLTCSLGEIARSSKMGVLEPHDDQSGDVPSMDRIIEAYEHSAGALGSLVQSQWTDEMLAQEIEVYGMTWKRGGALTMLITHQAHHRGQMTVLMRQAGLTVPGVLGPAREEWAQWEMAAQK